MYLLAQLVWKSGLDCHHWWHPAVSIVGLNSTPEVLARACLEWWGIDLEILFSAHVIAPLMPKLMVGSLGVILDASFSMEAQVTNISRSALTGLEIGSLSLPLWSSQCDPCNSLYSGLSLRLIQNLQLAQNVAAYVLTGIHLRGA